MIAIVTALKLERDAVLQLLSDVSEKPVDGRTAYEGRVGDLAVVVECFHGMGNVKAGVRTTQVIEKWKPEAVLLVGIAGGTDKPTSESLRADLKMLGDVLVAEQIIDYESGKLTTEGLEHRPQVFRSSFRWLEAARSLQSSFGIADVKASRPDGTTGRVISRMHFGDVASGQKVLKDQAPLANISSIFTKLVGAEMEGFGAAMAACDRDPPVQFLMVKAICDWADPDKNDAWQPYAADAAAACLVQIIRKAQRPTETTPAPKNDSTSPPSVHPKLIFVRQLGDSWKDLADAVGIAVYERAKFTQGDEPRHIWEWLDARARIGELAAALVAIGRPDLAKVCEPHP